MPSSHQSKVEFEQEIAARLGLVPNLYHSAPAAPEVMRQLWIETGSAFLDNALPPLFKERLMVYLSQLCGVRYCAVLHAGFLTGHGFVAGDAGAAPQSAEQLLELLRYPSPGDDRLQAALGLLQSIPGAQQQLPEPGDALEQAVFIACGALYLDAQRHISARDTLFHVLGRQWSEQIFALIGYASKLHFWVQLHPEIALDSGAKAELERHPELARLLLEGGSANQPAPPAPAGAAAATLQAESEQREQGLVTMFNHELRTPVAAISAVSDMLQMIGNADERLRNAGKVLQRQVQALMRIMDRLTDLSGLVGGSIPVAPAPTELDTVFSAALHELRPRFDEKEMKLEMQGLDRSLIVMADPQRLQQLFENLIGHILASCKPGLRLRIATAVDCGRLSMHFSLPQAAGTPRRMPAAAGSGALARAATSTRLALAKAIAQLHGGSLESFAGDGAVDHALTLPLAAAAAGAMPAAEKLRVLAIEDNRDFAQLFQHMLQIMGCELEIGSDAETGLKLAHQLAPQLIFCDIGLPGDMDGYDFARSLRADPKLAHIPLVAVSAYCSPDDVKLAQEAGFDRVCGKPVKFAEISAALAAFSNGTRRA
jgi:CheY-like chemotaxis protein